MGWVDLWRGILLCDVLSEKPTLRGVPVPMPENLMSGNNGNGFELGCPKSLRGISFIIDGKSGTGCLKFVQLEAKATQLPYDDKDKRCFLMHDWTITTWSNTKISSSWEDWDNGYKVQASDITIDGRLNSELLDSGLLLCKPPGDVDGAERALQNLLVSDPAPGIDATHEDIVYLMARVKFLHPKAWVLALDMRNNTLLSVAEFGTERERGARVVCCPCSISKYL